MKRAVVKGVAVQISEALVSSPLMLESRASS